MVPSSFYDNLYFRYKDTTTNFHQHSALNPVVKKNAGLTLGIFFLHFDTIPLLSVFSNLILLIQSLKIFGWLAEFSVHSKNWKYLKLAFCNTPVCKLLSCLADRAHAQSEKNIIPFLINVSLDLKGTLMSFRTLTLLHGIETYATRCRIFGTYFWQVF